MLDATFPSLMAYSSPYLETGFDPGRTGNRHSVPGSSPYGIYPTTDGWVAIMCVTDAHWRAFCARSATPRSAADAVARAPARPRAARRDEIDVRVASWTAYAVARRGDRDLSGASIPCAPVRTLGEAVDDPYNVEQGLLRRVSYEGWGEVRVLGSPIQLREPGEQRRRRRRPAPPPRLGEHNREILAALLGLDDDEPRRARSQPACSERHRRARADRRATSGCAACFHRRRSTTMRKMLLTFVAALALLTAPRLASAGVGVSIGIGLPFPQRVRRPTGRLRAAGGLRTAGRLRATGLPHLGWATGLRERLSWPALPQALPPPSPPSLGLIDARVRRPG